jgi:hypothetical protein
MSAVSAQREGADATCEDTVSVRRQVDRGVNLAVCSECHKPQSHNDFLFTFDKVKAAAAK